MAKILIVEDNKNSRYMLEKLLQAEGHQVIAAERGDVALRQVRQDPVDIVISDIMMPVMNGYRLCREMKRDDTLQNIPFIFYTATFVEQEDQALALSLGASRFLIKPMENSRFLALLHQVLEEYTAGSLPVPTEPPADIESVLEMYDNSLTRKLAETVEKLRKERRSLQESELKLKEAQEIAQMGHWELDLQDNRLRWSDEIYRLLGSKPREFEPSFATFFANIHPEDREMVEQTYQDSRSNKMSYAIDYRLQLKDNSIKYVHECGQTQYDEDGQPIYSVGTVQDITERKRTDEELRRHRENLEELIQERTRALEETNKKLFQENSIRTFMENELKLAKAEADEANQAKSVFLARMSHELRSPLAAILGYTKLMQGKVDPSNPLTRYINTINSSGQHLSDLIDDILEVSKIEAGHIELHQVAFDFPRLIEDVRAIMQGRADEKQLQLIVEGSEELPRRLLGDEAKIRQILVNLLSNAIKFTDQGSVTLRLGFRKNRGNELLMAVEDTGVGIPAEEIAKLFQPFGQTENGRSKGGTGLGLVISRQYAQLMGGDLKVTSSVGKGSLFNCTCRVEIDPVPDFCNWGTAKRRIIGLAPGMQKKTILIVDDHQDLRNYVRQLLKEVGFVTREADDGVAALNVIDTEPIDLVVMDIQMPVMGGYQTISRLRETERGKKLPIIGLSASAFEDDRQNALASGANDFLSKPINEEELFEKIGAFLGVKYRYAEPEDGPT